MQGQNPDNPKVNFNSMDRRQYLFPCDESERKLISSIPNHLRYMNVVRLDTLQSVNWRVDVAVDPRTDTYVNLSLSRSVRPDPLTTSSTVNTCYNYDMSDFSRVVTVYSPENDWIMSELRGIQLSKSIRRE